MIPKRTRFYGEENSLCSPSFFLFFMFPAKSSLSDEEVGFYTSLFTVLECYCTLQQAGEDNPFATSQEHKKNCALLFILFYCFFGSLDVPKRRHFLNERREV
ncbi:hypothetical protein CDAR_604531 [Caerostris darwini]|uniref:Uncharacterized protein n=1 Tax=Caerostris darwini TaxID=1538125 RepID=A0AAV4NAI2_9ARAC|nr:hypothetical protein CDAR_604531 [Caerostris darwini]